MPLGSTITGNPLGKLMRRIRWRAGLGHECAFWRTWLESRGGAWPADFNYRMDPHAQLEPHIATHLLPPPSACEDPAAQSPIRVLDVGAGPMTIVGKRLGQRTVEVTAVDPLADSYNALLDEFKVNPPVRTVRCAGEALTRRFQPGTFDLVISVNAVDHARDPLLVIRQMLAVAQPGAPVILEHTANEGERNAYEGLHQWNFIVEKGRLILWGKGTRIDVSEAVKDLAATTCSARVGRIFTVMRKHAH